MEINIFNIEKFVKTSEFDRLLRTEKQPSVILGMIYFEENWDKEKHWMMQMGITKKEMRRNCYKRLKRESWIDDSIAEIVLLRDYRIKWVSLA
jgi:hypothetical protein